jgi:poly(glycerol-phosphate) alpha-glucosyltransferase
MDVANLRNAIAGVPACRFIGPVGGVEKAQLLAQARFLALPSLSEGLPIAVLEAWAHATPALISQPCHWPEGYDSGAAIDCGTDASSIAQSIRQGFALPRSAWLAMSTAARQLAQTRFARTTVAGAWERTYAELLGLSA